MGLVRHLVPLGGRGEVDQQPPSLNPGLVTRDLVLLETWLSEPGGKVELIGVPGADDIFAVQPALTQRPADMVAGIGDDPKPSIQITNRELKPIDSYAPHGWILQLLHGSQVDPFRLTHRSFLLQGGWLVDAREGNIQVAKTPSSGISF